MKGIDWEHTTVRLSRSARVRCEPGWRLGPEWSRNLRDFDLWFVWAGRGRMETRMGEIILRPGICLWMRPGGRYEASQDESDRLGVNYLHFMLYDGSGRPLVDSPEIPCEVSDIEEVAYFDAVTSRIIQLKRRARMGGEPKAGNAPGVPELLMNAVLREMESGTAAVRAGGSAELVHHHRETILKQVARIYESPGDAPQVRDLARESGYSPDHFARVFKEVIGQTPQALKIHARVERARQLLSESSLSISGIAGVLGYDDVFFFSKQFKEKTGYSPSAYRKRG